MLCYQQIFEVLTRRVEILQRSCTSPRTVGHRGTPNSLRSPPTGRNVEVFNKMDHVKSRVTASENSEPQLGTLKPPARHCDCTLCNETDDQFPTAPHMFTVPDGYSVPTNNAPVSVDVLPAISSNYISSETPRSQTHTPRPQTPRSGMFEYVRTPNRIVSPIMEDALNEIRTFRPSCVARAPSSKTVLTVRNEPPASESESTVTSNVSNATVVYVRQPKGADTNSNKLEPSKN